MIIERYLSKIRPEKLTNRTKSQIVEDAEAGWLRTVLINPVECGVDCHCMVCWHKMADNILKAQGQVEYFEVETFVG